MGQSVYEDFQCVGVNLASGCDKSGTQHTSKIYNQYFDHVHKYTAVPDSPQFCLGAGTLKIF